MPSCPRQRRSKRSCVYLPHLSCASTFHTSRPAQCEVKCGTQVLLAVRLEQDLDSTLASQLTPDTFIPLRGDENDWHFLAPANEVALQLGSRDTRHGDVQDQTIRLSEASGVQEFFS